MSIGSSIGTVAGALTGSPAGAAIGGSIGDGIESAITAGRARKMDVPQTDPLQTQVLADLQRKMKAIEVGTFGMGAQNAITQSAARSQNAITRMTSGDIGASVQGLQRVQAGAGRATNELFDNLSLEGLRLQQLAQSQANLIAERKRQLQQFEQDRLYAQAAATGRDATQNISALGARGDLPAFRDIFPKKTPAQVSGSSPVLPVNANPVTGAIVDSSQITPGAEVQLGGSLTPFLSSF